MFQQVKQALDSVNYVSTTVDLWSAHNKIFLGMTAHWIDPDSTQRCKAALLKKYCRYNYKHMKSLL